MFLLNFQTNVHTKNQMVFRTEFEILEQKEGVHYNKAFQPHNYSNETTKNSCDQIADGLSLSLALLLLLFPFHFNLLFLFVCLSNQIFHLILNVVNLQLEKKSKTCDEYKNTEES